MYICDFVFGPFKSENRQTQDPIYDSTDRRRIPETHAQNSPTQTLLRLSKDEASTQEFLSQERGAISVRRGNKGRCDEEEAV